MSDSIAPAFQRNELVQPAPGAMSYMMSSDSYVGPLYCKGGRHLMFYFPRTDRLA